MSPAGSSPQISPASARIALAGMASLTLNVGAEDFDTAVADVLRARQELQAVIDADEALRNVPERVESVASVS